CERGAALLAEPDGVEARARAGRPARPRSAGPVTPTGVDALRRVPLFVGLADDDLAAIAEAANEVEVPPGQLLVQPGQAGSGMFFICEGTAVVETRREHVELGPGQFFGELALMKPDAIRTARVGAKTPRRGLALARGGF